MLGLELTLSVLVVSLLLAPARGSARPRTRRLGPRRELPLEEAAEHERQRGGLLRARVDDDGRGAAGGVPGRVVGRHAGRGPGHCVVVVVVVVAVVVLVVIVLRYIAAAAANQ